MIELCKDERHIKKLAEISEDLEALNSLDDLEEIERHQIAVLNKYKELASKGLNIAVFSDAIKDISFIKEQKTGTACFKPIDERKAIKKRITDEKQKMNSHFGALTKLQAILPDTVIGASIHNDLQNALEALQDVLNRRFQLALYKECYPILAGLVDGFSDKPTNINLDGIMKIFSIEEVEKITNTRKGKKDSFAVIVQGIHGLWKDNIIRMFEECQRIRMNKKAAYKVILDFLATVFPNVWGYSEETKERLLKTIGGHCNR